MARVWLIIGASRGLGRGPAEAVLDSGDRLVATARRPEQLDDLVSRYGDQVRTVALDVTDAAAAHDAVRACVDAFGRLDQEDRDPRARAGGTVAALLPEPTASPNVRPPIRWCTSRGKRESRKVRVDPCTVQRREVSRALNGVYRWAAQGRPAPPRERRPSPARPCPPRAA